MRCVFKGWREHPPENQNRAKMGRMMGLRTSLLCVAAINALLGAEAKLVLLVTLTRHGSRAPNTVVDELCPADKGNRLAYNVPPGQLTEIGMQQALELGKFLRETYVDSMEFLPPDLGSGSQKSFSSRFMSDSAERCLQTAQAMGQGLFPNGTGPTGFPNQPIAVQTEQKQFANTLAAAHGACLPQQKEDNKLYDEGIGKEVVENSKNVTDIIAESCGTSVDDYAKADGGKEGLVLGIKDVADMLDFDEQQGLPRLEGVSKQAHEEMTALAFTLLQERYYSTPQQITYWAGALPSQMLDDFEAAEEKHRKGEEPSRLYIGYHGHRELLYGLAHLLGWEFNVQDAPRALGTSSIPPATTMFFELHYHETVHGSSSEQLNDQQGDSTAQKASSSKASQGAAEAAEEGGYYYVRTYTWTPQFGQQEVVLDACKGDEAGKGCRLSSLKYSILEHVAKSGSWEDICHHVPFTQAEVMAQDTVYGSGGATIVNGTDTVVPKIRRQPVSLLTKASVLTAIIAAAIVLWLVAVIIRAKALDPEGSRGDDYEIVA